MLAAAPLRAAVVPVAVYDALAVNPDGRAYVAIVLTGATGITIDAQQQHVLDALDAEEFELVHRPADAPGLVGSVNESGLAKLAAHPAVALVHLDVMNLLYVMESATEQDLAELKARSLFILTNVLVWVSARQSGNRGGAFFFRSPCHIHRVSTV